MLDKIKDKLKNLVPGVDRIWDALNPLELSPLAKVGGWCAVGLVLVLGFWVLA